MEVINIDNQKTKTCSVCGEKYPATTEYFYKKKNGLYGLESRCKNCAKLKRTNDRIKNNKTKTITISLSEDEYKIAKDKAQNLNMNLSDYLKFSVLKNNSSYMLTVDKNLTDFEAYELSKIGININQIAHICNTTGNMYPTDIKYLKDIMQECWILMDKMYKKIDNINKIASELDR